MLLEPGPPAATEDHDCAGHALVIVSMRSPVRVLHVLPHRGGGGEVYVDMLERLAGYTHERVYLSSGRSPASGLVSIPGGLLTAAARARAAADLLHPHGDVAPVP